MRGEGFRARVGRRPRHLAAAAGGCAHWQSPQPPRAAAASACAARPCAQNEGQRARKPRSSSLTCDPGPRQPARRRRRAPGGGCAHGLAVVPHCLAWGLDGPMRPCDPARARVGPCGQECRGFAAAPPPPRCRPDAWVWRRRKLVACTICIRHAHACSGAAVGAYWTSLQLRIFDTRKLGPY